ncbi:MAG: DNA primase [Oscillospiraceae bacterium]|jgi:DNA primase|nr:DNA primase [Oscillospiraceae bacterium]
MPVPDLFIDELVSRTDITELVSEYVRLTKKSGANMFGLCPFHSEKTPSFTVNSEKQIYHCFGCGKGGGAITFVREIENLTFLDAIEVLAKKAGMVVPQEDGQVEITGWRKRILALNRDAAKHFYRMLISPAGKTAQEYLAKRKISKTSIQKFGIGAAPDDWSLLLEAMTAKGYTKQELVDAGLCRYGKTGGSAYDFFRNRLIFPVIDARGDVVAFSGRTLNPNDKDYKYLNSPDTLVFTKSKTLFGLNIARKSKYGAFVLVEGNIDVVMLHQAGFDSVVAPLGTALTADQARLIKQYTQNVVIAFDSDDAGEKATMRAITHLEKAGISIKVIDLGASKDPDNFIKDHGRESFKTLLERSDGHIDYKILSLLNSNDMNTNEGRLSFINTATELIAEINNAPEREIYGTKVAELASVSIESIKNEVNRKLKIKINRDKKSFDKSTIQPKINIQPTNRDLRYDNIASAIAEEGVIRCLVQDPLLFKVTSEIGFTKDEFSTEFLGNIYKMLEEKVKDSRQLEQKHIMAELEPGIASQLMRILDKPESIAISDKSIRDYIARIRAEKFKDKSPDSETLLDIVNLKKKN